MDTNKLKRFATLARNILLQGVSQRVLSLGFTEKGEAEEQPQKFEGGATFMGEVVSTDFYDKWMSLNHAIKSKGINEVVEEAAYTWFNRLIAIRIMVKNNLLAPVLAYESEGTRTPLLISEAEQGRIPQMSEENRQKCETLLNEPSRANELFSILIVAFCHSTPIINKCFGAIADYTELLLPTNILAKEGFIDLLNSTDYIKEEDYHSPELIGWLYQFYIAEKKDNVFASFKNGKKAEAEDIPAATQIFTPNWIVKYMVQNTVGRIYMDNNPYTGIKDGMNYLVENEEPTNPENILTIDDIHELTCADLACGSGHILNECFDLLFQIYKEEGYSSKIAIEDIFKYNLTGIDLDTRAKQLAQFALLMKACQKDNGFVDAHCLPHVYDMPDAYEDKDALRRELPNFLMTDDKTINEEVMDAFTLMDEAKNLGSIMKFGISERTRNIIAQRMEEYENEDFVSEGIKSLFPYMYIILTLTKKYSALVMNPPYMGSNNMNQTLIDYVKTNYVEGKADLFSVFMILAKNRLCKNGKYGMINQDSWIFKSSFNKLRQSILGSQKIDSLLHLGARTFDEMSGEVLQNVTFVIANRIPNELDNGVYFRLLKGKSCSEKENLYINALYEKSTDLYYPQVYQRAFEKIPGSKLGYWLNKKLVNCFELEKLGSILTTREGMAPADEKRFWRLWHEIETKRFSKFNKTSDKWYPYVKGGSYRKWYGNFEYIVDWANNGYDIKNNIDPNTGRIRSHNYNGALAFKECLSWTVMYFGRISIRYTPEGCLWDSAGASGFSPLNLFQAIGLLNSVITKKFISVLSDAKKMNVGEVALIPFINKQKECIETITSKNISISKQDWDAHETSWDFQQNELLSINEDTYKDNIQNSIEKHFKETGERMRIAPTAPNLSSLEWRMEQYKQKWEHKFMQLHANEEELNKQFIDIYSLQDELTPDVPLDEITILQQGEISIENNSLVWHDDVIIKQLISYAVGCMMGRYSIDKPGLILANQEDGIQQYNELVSGSRFEIDDDGIIPLMSSNTEFTDAATKRFKNWLTVTFSEESLVENLNFVEKCLGKPLDDYFVKQFWKDHKKMYQNRPIYWLFSSKKGAFQCLVYMHRMNPYTAEKIRTGYLLPHIEWLVSKQNEMQANAANLSTRERKELDNIGKQIEECREYHDRLHVIADEQIHFDLDDGIVVNYAKFGDVLQKIK